MISLAVSTDMPSLVAHTAETLKLSRDEIAAASVDHIGLARMALEGIDSDCFLPDADATLEAFLLDSAIGNEVRGAALSEPVAAQKILQAYLDTYRKWDPKQVFTDEQAVFWFVSQLIKDDALHTEDPMSAKARNAAKDMLALQLPGQKIAPAPFLNLAGSANFSTGLPVEACKFDDAILAAEAMQYRAQPMWVKYCRLWVIDPPKLREHTRAMVQRVEEAEATERFKFTGVEKAFPMRNCAAYNYNGVLVVYIGDTCLVLDNSAADYIRTVCTSLRNASIAFADYRMTGMPDKKTNTMYHAFKTCLAWVGNAISRVDTARFVARHMHLTYTRWQNMVGEAHAPIDAGWAERDAALKKDVEDVYPADSKWWDLVQSFQIPDRDRAELFKLYHLLPPPDINAKVLHEELTKKTSQTNPYKPAKIKEFINFCASYDYVRYLSKHKRDPMGKADGEYDYYNKPWYKKSIAGSLTMPPRDEWGLVRLSKIFPFEKSGDFHVLTAKDSTRVVAKEYMYTDRDLSRDLQDKDQNELLSALFGDGKLSNGDTMQEWRERVFAKAIRETDAIIAAEAGKAENTKPGKKVRETLSACDIAREFLTEIDQAIRPLAEQTPGVSIRVDQVRHKRKFQSMAQATSTQTAKATLATSTDISGWSPNMPREMFHAWQDYALSTTECPDPTAVREIWKRLKVFVDRRGYKAISPCPEGNIQGWPATSDTTMHAHILIYWAYQLREQKILSDREAAYTLCLIDDAATAVVIDDTAKAAKEKADRARALLKAIYADLGFVMDEVKSFFSSIKFVYLNELYLDGAQVMHATKTMMRIDRDHARRFATLSEQCGAAMGTAASAAAQGADPFFAYWMAAWVAYRLAYRTCPAMADLPPYDQAVVALTPVSFNGLGIRPITAVMATGANDEFTWFCEVLRPIAIHAPDLAGLMGAVLSQEVNEASAASLFKNPSQLMASSHRSASAAVRRAFRSAARARGLAEPFCSLDAMEEDPGYVKAVTAVMEAGAHESALLQEISSAMPDSFVDETLARVDKSELVASLLGSKGIGNLRRRVQMCDKTNLETIVHLAATRVSHRPGVVAELQRLGSFKFVYNMRERAHQNIIILNHTYPCPFALWAFQGEANLDDDSSIKYSTVSFDSSRLFSTVGSKSRNLYDSVVQHIGYKGYRSVNANVANEARVAIHDPVKRKIAAGLAALRWARDHGAHYEALTDLFMYAWGGMCDVRILDLPGKRFEGSAKRMSLRHAKVNHLVFPFPNTQAAVRVDARAITRAQAGTHHMYDIMGAITAMRAAGLLEAALQVASGRARFAYKFAYKPDSEAVLVVPEERQTEVPLEDICIFRPFSDLPSPLAASAKVCTTYGAMSSVLHTYLSAGAKAAEKVYQSLVDADEIDQEHFYAQEQEVLRARVMTRAKDMGKLEAAKQIVLTDVLPTPGSGGFVATERAERKQAENFSTTAAALPEGEALYLLGSGINDTTAVAMATDAPEIAAVINLESSVHEPDKLFEHERWADLRAWVGMQSHDALNILAAVDEVRGSTPKGEALAEVFRGMGVPGFRIRDADDPYDFRHAMVSFANRPSSLANRIIGVNRSLKKLRKNYDENVFAGATSSTRANARIISARWRFAAARYSARADEIAKNKGDRAELIRLNYRSKFTRAAADTLDGAGTLPMRELNRKLADGFGMSAAHRITNADKRAEFEEELADEGLSGLDDIDDDEDLRDVFDGIRELASKYGATVNVDVAWRELQEIKGWVKKDLAGFHKAIKVTSRFRTHKAVPAPPSPARHTEPGSSGRLYPRAASPDPEPEPEPPQVPEVVFTMPTSGAIGGDDEGDFEDIFDYASVAAIFQFCVDKELCEDSWEEYDRVTADEKSWTAFKKRMTYLIQEQDIEFEEPDAILYDEREIPTGEGEGSFVRD